MAGEAKEQQRPQARTAIVTGSARGIGRAIAIRLAEDGFDVCINDIEGNRGLVDETVETIKHLGRNATGVIADVSRRGEVARLVDASVAALGPLTVMVANAGITQMKPALEVSEDDVHRMFSINFNGVFNCYQLAAKQFIRQGSKGKILGAASVVSFRPMPLLAHYSASKWAVRGLTQGFAMEVAAEGITVNAYAPGMVGTAMWEANDEAMAKINGAEKGATLKKASEAILMGRVSVPEDVAKTVSFLAGPDSDYMTGQTLLIDGGIQFS